jgi:hypothetical protein
VTEVSNPPLPVHPRSVQPKSAAQAAIAFEFLDLS